MVLIPFVNLESHKVEPFKNKFNKSLIKKYESLLKNNTNFNKKKYYNLLVTLETLEMKERVKLIKNALLLGFENHSYKELIKELDVMVQGLTGFEVWPISQIVEDHGINFDKDLNITFRLIEKITTNFTAEFLIRPFLIKYPEYTFEKIYKWSESQNEHLRRLASEGTRPNLPWGQKLPMIKDFLPKNIEILNKLKFDDSLYVRKSVANHLNDISRIDEALFFRTIKAWKRDKISPQIIKQALRTKLKEGSREALEILEIKDHKNIEISELKINPKKIELGNNLEIFFKLKNKAKKEEKALIHFNLYFLKNNKKHSLKSFKIKEVKIKGLEQIEISKSFPIKKVTTRKYYSGVQFFELQINSTKSEKIKFQLNCP